ncbi:SH3 domain-containing protein [Streptomyces sp. NPDC052013]|uniref:SH3 domain-containing protein n=1 Tax=Streptomyces sp. NPDC052013 TaxID=3365679 RepID=UPI0037D16073
MTLRRRRSVLLGAATGAFLMVLGTAAEAAVRYYPVAPGVQVNVRSGPGTNYNIVRVLPAGASVPIYCQTPGTTVTGPYGTSNIWDNISNGEYVSDAYVKTGSDGYVASRCA